MKNYLFILFLLSFVFTNAQIPDTLKINKQNIREFINYSDTLRLKGETGKSLEILYSVLHFLEPVKLQDKEINKNLTTAYLKLSSIYEQVNDSLGFYYADKVIPLAKKINDYKKLSNAYYFRFIHSYDMENKKNQEISLDSCIKYSLLSNSKNTLVGAYIAKCELLADKNKNKGINYCNKAEEVLKQIDDDFTLCSEYSNLASVLKLYKQDNKALNFFIKSYEYAKKTKYLDFLNNAYYQLAYEYYNQKNYKKASDYFILLTDSIEKSHEIELKKRFVEADTKFQAEKKDKLIAIQKLKLLKEKQQKNKIIIIGITLLFLLAFFFQRLIYRNKKRKELIENKLQKEVEINMIRKEFLTNISHEIRTPVTLVTGNLELAMDNLSNKEKLKKYLKLSISNSKKILDNANQLLELQKLEAKETPPKSLKIDLVRFTKRIFYSFESYARIKNISLEYNCSIKDGTFIKSDPDRIEKILNNFISNAIKYSPSNKKIVFESKIKDDKIFFTVIDFGIGIDKKEHKKVFERFYQAEKSKNVGGVGIGLALSIKLAKSLGGNIDLKSETNKGSAFTFILPAEIFYEKENNKASISNDDYQYEIINDSKLSKILIVDDNPEMVQYIKEILSEFFVCDTAYDGFEAIEKIKTTRYDLIVSDVMMPGMNGFELKRRINNISVFKNIPFVFLTAKHQKESKIEALTMGVDDYITKPFHKDELVYRIKNILINKKEREKWAIENPKLVSDSTTDKEKFLSKIIEIINNNIEDESFNTQKLAEKIGYSTRQLNRLLKIHTGLTSLGFIHEIKLQKAYHCLATKKFETISEVRYFVGIQSSGHFNKLFFKRFGIKPNDLLKKEG